MIGDVGSLRSGFGGGLIDIWSADRYGLDSGSE